MRNLHWKHSHLRGCVRPVVPTEIGGLLDSMVNSYWENIVIEPFIACAKRDVRMAIKRSTVKYRLNFVQFRRG